MVASPLHIISSEKKEVILPASNIGNKSRRLPDEQQAIMEREWLRNPEQFDPHRSCIDRERIARTLALMKRHCKVQDKVIADLGCGYGVLSKALHEESPLCISALDIAANALKMLQKSLVGGNFNKIKIVRDALPDSKLPDSFYDIVLCCDVIAYLHPKQYRLLFSELARVVKPDGYIVCSTLIDYKTEGPWRKFSDLVDTEIVVEEWLLSYHRLYHGIIKILELPNRYLQIRCDPSFRQGELEKCRPLARRCQLFYSCWIFTPLWRLLRMVTFPLRRYLEKNNKLLRYMEAISRILWDEAAITHAIAIGKRRPINLK